MSNQSRSYLEDISCVDSSSTKGTNQEIRTSEAIEDGQDGYRSSLQELLICEENLRPIFREVVGIRKSPNPEQDCIELINSMNLCVLRVGTSYWDEYYPCFTFEFNPERLTQNLNILQKIKVITDLQMASNKRPHQLRQQVVGACTINLQMFYI